jgi:hypothetical protein
MDDVDETDETDETDDMDDMEHQMEVSGGSFLPVVGTVAFLTGTR